MFEKASNHLSLVSNFEEYTKARQANKHAAFVGIQGANAVEKDIYALESVAHFLILCTVVHLTYSTPWNQ